jgi:DNA-binding Lrp family transcriptional regulator
MPSPIPPQVIRRIQDMRKSGFSIQDIAFKLGIGRNTVGRHLKAAKESKIRREGKIVPPLKVEEIRRLRFFAKGIVQFGPCRNCKYLVFVWTGQKSGYCSWCGTRWA